MKRTLLGAVAALAITTSAMADYTALHFTYMNAYGTCLNEKSNNIIIG